MATGLVMDIHHTPVLLEPVLELLLQQESRLLVDCTTGEGGHSKEFLEKSKDLKLVSLDADSQIQQKAKNRLKDFHSRISFVHTWFDEFFEGQGKDLGADAILVDLGISVFHYQESGRGFTFRGDEPLDMRLDPSTGPSAADLVNGMKEAELADMIFRYGEDRFSRRIASRIVRKREIKPFSTVGELEEEIWLSYPKKSRHNRLHPATKAFQALRIAVNRELDRLERLLEYVWDAIAPGGRLGIITFHSLEDRMVKQAFRAKSMEKEWALVNKKPLVPTDQEIEENPPSRSAKLRVIERRNG